MTANPTPRWEYWQIKGWKEIGDLNEAGQQGWELVAAPPTSTGGVFYIFKRQIPPARDSAQKDQPSKSPAGEGGEEV